ncbi:MULTISPECIES: flagellar protein FliT [unclassified Gilliamella]|uniref:flagellar protein FliT n=1 Tax=unclassified Gilliamella TaxID=2685620 RepID=UPI000810A408|nr:MULTISPECIES: hypothetical protein [Gilliamella]MCX8583703.1 hypothetical protein [Gilliamella sp. B3372]MCX8586285.1 hypothetical protein [Gilliamella sp. B3562]MCX8595088.1 hypothetical protein [Gilliamella sp. B3367]MCX8683771.1 hypothetical protein [Gilliamella sp. B2889]MCX8685758.1 hypothetical protein [Gilliamella sp. B2864]
MGISVLNNNLLLEQYEKLNYVVEQMLINAQKENWESLISWQAQYHQLSKDIQLNVTDTIALPQQDIIRMYINNILGYQEQLEQLIHLRHGELTRLIGEQVNYQTKIDSYQKIANLA